MKFTFLEVKDNDLLDKVFAFRYSIMTQDSIFFDYAAKNVFPDGKESDKYDPYSIHFAALNEENEVCATVRLVHNSPVGYPTENSMTFDRERFEREKLGEISRIFVDAKYRNIQTTKIIIEHVKEFMYLKMMELGIEYSYGALEKSFLRLLKMYKMNYEIIGEKQEHIGLRYPCILYTRRLGFDNPQYIKLWKEQHVS